MGFRMKISQRGLIYDRNVWMYKKITVHVSMSEVFCVWCVEYKESERWKLGSWINFDSWRNPQTE